MNNEKLENDKGDSLFFKDKQLSPKVKFDDQHVGEEIIINSNHGTAKRLLSNQDIKGFGTEGDDFTCEDMIHTTNRESE